MARVGRSVRRTNVRVRLGERDEALFAALARFGIARTDQLRQLFFPGRHRDVFADRMRKLFDAGYLSVEATGLNEQNLYTLGARGKAWADGQELSWVRPPKAGREHWLAVVSIWVSLSGYCHDTSEWALLSFRPEWELRPSAGLAEPVIPDALAEVSLGPERVLRLAIEVDMGHERAGVLRRKVRAYRAALLSGEGIFGWTDLSVGFALHGWAVGRMVRFREMLERELPAPYVVWDLGAGIGEALVTLARQSQPPATSSRCSDGSVALVSACEDGIEANSGGGL